MALKVSTVSAAESLTGGMTASEIVGRSGASKYFLGGIVTYSLDAKVKHLGVDRDIAESYDCVSETVAAQMAVGVSRLFDTDFGLSTTGFAEPCGDQPQRAFVGLHDRRTGQTVVRHITLDEEVGAPATRNDFRRRVVHLAMDMLRSYAKLPPGGMSE